MKVTAVAKRIRWRADRDGTAHAYTGWGRGGALCGRRNPGAERHDWPAHERCVNCLLAAVL